MEAEKVNEYFYNTPYEICGKSIDNISYLYVLNKNEEYMFILNFSDGSVKYNKKNINLNNIKKQLNL